MNFFIILAYNSEILSKFAEAKKNLMKHIKTALIGFGYRGKQLLRLLRTIESYEIVGIADINGCGDSESPGASFYKGEEAYKMMLDEQQPNLVFITTPWHLHITHATECILRNCHVALEIKGGLCQDEYAPLQEIAQQKGVKVFPLENTLFMREILAVKRMVDEGALGEIIYMRGGYRHDLRKLLLDDNGVLGGRKGTESVWRSRFYSHHNADIYPTHGLGPLCMILGIGKSTVPIPTPGTIGAATATGLSSPRAVSMAITRNSIWRMSMIGAVWVNLSSCLSAIPGYTTTGSLIVTTRLISRFSP